MKFMVYISSGEVLRAGECPDAMVSIQAGVGESVAAVPEGIDSPENYYVDAGVLIAKPARPSANHVFEYATKQWVDPRTLDDLKTVKWAGIKAARDSAEFSTFAWDGSSFDSDAASQSRIQGAAQLATLATMNSQAFSIDWTLADNTVRTLSAADMIAVGTAMGVHISTQHTHARLKRAEIEAATTAAEVEAITW